MSVIYMVKSFLLQPENLHILLAVLMLMPFTMFVLFTSIFPTVSYQPVKNKKDNSQTRKTEKELKAEEDLEKALIAELEEFRRRRQKEQSERRRQKEKPEHNISVVSEIEKNVGEIKGFAFDEKRSDNAAICSLILNLISRGVDELKIAQSIKFKYGQKMSEDEVIQLIAAINDFLELMTQKYIKEQCMLEKLPSFERCLKGISNGDVFYCLEVLQSAIKRNMTLLENAPNVTMKNSYIREISHQACVYSVLAGLKDYRRAASGLDLALKYDADNMSAWNLAANAYLRVFKDDKAFMVFQKIIDESQDSFVTFETANAYKHMAFQSFENGKTDEALRYYDTARQFYQELRINEKLNAEENEVLNFMIENQNKDMPAIIDRLSQNEAY